MKLKYLFLIVFTGFILLNTTAQKYITKSGVIEIYSQTPLFTFKGVNKKVGSIFDAEVAYTFDSGFALGAKYISGTSSDNSVTPTKSDYSNTTAYVAYNY